MEGECHCFTKPPHASVYQRAPLHIAAKGGFKYTVDTLVKKGANIKIKDKNGVSGTGLLKCSEILYKSLN